VTRVALRSVTAVLLSVLFSAVAFPQEPEPAVLTDVRIEGASVYTLDELQRRYGLAPGVRLKEKPEEIAASIKRRYSNDGYTFAEVKASLDESGVLTIAIDEGQIDEIEFHGIGADATNRLREEFAVRPGDVFNRPQASRALDEALEVGQGAIERRHSDDTFKLIRDNGRRILEIALRERSARSGVFLGSQGREDWYSPVDGFNPAIGFQSTLFDTHRFNHTYWGGYFGYKFAAERVGYSFGIERPFLRDSVLQVGGSIHDLTGSDDRWRLSDLEQSLVAVGFRNTFRDYYRRKGYQVHAAARPLANHEWLVAWRSEEHLSLDNETDYGFFRDDEVFRANRPIQEGDLRSLILGYTLDTRGLAREEPGVRFRRHLVDSLFGQFTERDHGARLEWTSEFAPASFDQDFDFSRHIVNARAWIETAPTRTISGRALAGFSDGTLPPQRVFAIGGIGTVHGYSFKEAAGEGMLLFNGEFRQRFGRSPFAGLAFIDSGRVYRPLPGSTTDWLTGLGVGLELGGARVELGWRLDDIPSSLQVLFRLSPTF
jgi:hypothetical protein